MNDRRVRSLRALFAVAALLIAATAFGAATADYTTLKKYISARMLSEAYFELLRCELQNKDEDPKLTKLRKDLLKPVRDEAGKRARITPDDPKVRIILGDIEFHEGRYDAAVQHLTKALDGDAGALGHYTLAKIFFAKGKMAQSFDQLEKALQIDPSSEVLFDDFQFLYNAKNYGLASAKRLTGKAGFPRRATPVAAENAAPTLPDNPFENDPTAPPDVPLPPEPQPEPDLLQTAGVPTLPDKPVSPPVPDEPDFPAPDETDFPASSEAQLPDEPPPAITIATAPEVANEDPERTKMKDADYWFDQAKRKFDDGKYDEAETTLTKAVSIFSGLPGREELQAKIEAKKDLDRRYRTAVGLYQSEKYDIALPDILKAYEEEPDKYAEAVFYLGKIYILGSNRDLQKARQYFEKFQNLPNCAPELRRDVDWVMIGILTDDQQYEEAYRRFNEFVEREREYAENQSTYTKLRWTLFYQNHTTEFWAGLGIFAGAFIFVFILMIAPALNLFIFDPVKKATAALDAGQTEKAVRIADDALRQRNIPIQTLRLLLEISVQGHYTLKNYFKCQENARHLLQEFTDNPIGWKYLAKSYLETNTSSDEAITLYETQYKNDPNRTEFLPILCKYYATQKQYTADGMEFMYAFYQIQPTNRDNVKALADAYVQNKRMGDEVVTILQEAVKISPENDGYRELLARNYSKKAMYAEAARECLQVLSKNINNMGIHVVYTTCMKKMNMLDEAVLQYEEFLRRYPGNPQLTEIVTGLRKELEQATRSPDALSGVDELSPFSDEMIAPEFAPLPTDPVLPAIPSESDIRNFVEPPPEGFDASDASTPLPDFLKMGGQEPVSVEGISRVPPTPGFSPSGEPPLPTGISDDAGTQTASGTEVSSVADFIDEIQIPKTSEPGMNSVDDILSISTLDPFAAQGLDGTDLRDDLGMTGQEELMPPPPPASKQPPDEGGGKELEEARLKASQKKWEDVVTILGPAFASKRSQDIGLLLADAYIHLKKTSLAREIIETLEFDRELMSDPLKDQLYRIGIALESAGDTNGALFIYDMICNVDINFRDTFDRSDKLYASIKKGK
ncbi:tetratricopeptide repeat protein [Candidatus Ozemobacteraceae bacterium]|nr:tetratricopeptide repeat protein [Candidatus Ozemobacteraceae bacterium]